MALPKVQQPRTTSPIVDEVKTVIKEINSGKTPRTDGISAELCKAQGTTASKASYDILVSIWEEECMQADFNDAIIVSLYKNKEAKSDCESDRGFPTFHCRKILARILLNRLITSVSESNSPEPQRDFRPGRSTVDIMFAVHQVKEKCI